MSTASMSSSRTLPRSLGDRAKSVIPIISSQPRRSRRAVQGQEDLLDGVVLPPDAQGPWGAYGRLVPRQEPRGGKVELRRHQPQKVAQGPPSGGAALFERDLTGLRPCSGLWGEDHRSGGRAAFSVAGDPQRRSGVAGLFCGGMPAAFRRLPRRHAPGVLVDVPRSDFVLHERQTDLAAGGDSRGGRQVARRPGPCGHHPSRGLHPSNFGLARIHARGLLGPHARSMRTSISLKRTTPSRVVLDRGNKNGLRLGTPFGQSLDYSYAHHIQRLMVTGNFMLLAGIDPGEVDRWYLGIYIDAIEWVEITNTRGMSQFADGGIVGTKPYAASANYMKKMGPYCSGCSYDAADKTGDNSCPLNSLYWHFHARNRAKLERNPRIGMATAPGTRCPLKSREALLERGDAVLANLENL